MIDRYQCEGDAFCQPIRCNSSSASHRYLIIKKNYERVLLFFVFNLLAKVGVYLNEEANKDCGGTANHGPHEEVAVANGFLQPASGHTRKHHAQSHEASTDSVV